MQAKGWLSCDAGLGFHRRAVHHPNAGHRRKFHRHRLPARHAHPLAVTKDGVGAPALTDIGASFAITTGGVLTLFLAAPPNGGSVWVRLVKEVSGAVFEQEFTADPPANTQFLSPRLFLNNGATAAAVSYDCSGVYLETDD